MRKRNEVLTHIIWVMLMVLLLAAVAAMIGIEIYVWVCYGGKPTSEIPLWALWFMLRG